MALLRVCHLVKDMQEGLLLMADAAMRASNRNPFTNQSMKDRESHVGDVGRETALQVASGLVDSKQVLQEVRWKGYPGPCQTLPEMTPNEPHPSMILQAPSLE